MEWLENRGQIGWASEASGLIGGLAFKMAMEFGVCFVRRGD